MSSSKRLLTGEADYLDGLSVDEVRQLSSDDKLRIEKAKIGRWYTLQFQVDKPPFSDIRLRKAIAYAIDRDRIDKLVMGGQAPIANGPLPNGVWWSSPDTIVYEHDPDKAKALLKEAGIAPGTRLTLAAPDNSVLRKEDQLVAEQLAAVGLNVQLAPVSQAEWYARVVQKAINFTPMRWSQTADPDNTLYILLDSKGYANTTGYSNPDVDRLLEQARQEQDQAKRTALYAAVKKQVMADLPYIPLYFSAEYAAIAKSVKGFTWSPDEIPRFRRTWRGQA
jgi:peptide/nickel transport system substrate-binding protein